MCLKDREVTIVNKMDIFLSISFYSVYFLISVIVFQMTKHNQQGERGGGVLNKQYKNLSHRCCHLNLVIVIASVNVKRKYEKMFNHITKGKTELPIFSVQFVNN